MQLESRPTNFRRNKMRIEVICVLQGRPRPAFHGKSTVKLTHIHVARAGNTQTDFESSLCRL